MQILVEQCIWSFTRVSHSAGSMPSLRDEKRYAPLRSGRICEERYCASRADTDESRAPKTWTPKTWTVISALQAIHKRSHSEATKKSENTRMSEGMILRLPVDLLTLKN